MRITGGRLGGLVLAEVGRGDPGAQLRPTSDRVRESLFNILAHHPEGDRVDGARVLDLFAGTGALGIEALSRGARTAVLVDKGRTARRLVMRNLELAGLGSEARYLHRDATRLGPPEGKPATLVFCDPPYGRNLGARTLAAALASGWIADGALAVLEDGSEPETPQGFVREDLRRYGDTRLAFLRAQISGD